MPHAEHRRSRGGVQKEGLCEDGFVCGPYFVAMVWLMSLKSYRPIVFDLTKRLILCRHTTPSVKSAMSWRFDYSAPQVMRSGPKLRSWAQLASCGAGAGPARLSPLPAASLRHSENKRPQGQESGPSSAGMYGARGTCHKVLTHDKKRSRLEAKNVVLEVWGS